MSDIEVRAFFLADHGAAVEGKLYVAGGGFTQVVVPGFPATLPVIYLVGICATRIPVVSALSLTNGQPAGQISHMLEISMRMEGEEEHPLGNITFAVSGQPGSKAQGCIAIPILGIEVARAGTISFQLSIGGDQIAACEVQINHARPAGMLQIPTVRKN